MRSHLITLISSIDLSEFIESYSLIKISFILQLMNELLSIIESLYVWRKRSSLKFIIKPNERRLSANHKSDVIIVITRSYLIWKFTDFRWSCLKWQSDEYSLQRALCFISFDRFSMTYIFLQNHALAVRTSGPVRRCCRRSALNHPLHR